MAMKVGAEDRKKLIIAIVAMVLAVLLIGRWVLSMSGSTSSANSVAPPVVIPAAPIHKVASHAKSGNKKVVAERSLDPSLRYDWLKVSEDTKYSGSGRNIFRAQADIPPPIAPANTDKPKVAEGPPVQQAPPPPPPINLKFFGFASKPGEPKKVFLSQNEDVFIAHEGDIVDRRYKVERITPMAVEIEDVQNNNRQSIPLTQQQ